MTASLSDPIALADRLAVARRLRELTQTQLAEAAGVPQAQVSRIERGAITDPGFSTVAGLARALRVSLDALAAPSGDRLLQELAGSGSHRDGTLLGKSALTQTPVLVRDFAQDPEHLLIVGELGSGRSFAAKLELLRAHAAGASGCAIDMEGGDNRLAGTDEVELSSINPLAVPLAASIYQHIEFLAFWLSGLSQQRSNNHNAVLVHALIGLYQGAYEYDPDTLGADMAQCPVLSELFLLLTRLARKGGSGGRQAATEIAATLTPYCGDGALEPLLGQNVPALSSSVTRVHFPRALAGLRPALTALVFWQLVAATTRSSPSDPLRIIAVEVPPEDSPYRTSVMETAHKARERGVALTLISTLSSDGAGDIRELFSLASTTLLLRSSPETLEALAKSVPLSHESRMRLARAVGEGLLLRDGESGWVTIKGTATPAEHAQLYSHRSPSET